MNSTNSANSSSTTNTNSSTQANSNQTNSSSNQPNNAQMLGNDFNTTAAYLWSMVLSQQQQNNSNRNSSSSNGGLLNGDLISPSSNNNHNNSTTNGSASSLANSTLALNLSRSLSNLASGAGQTAGSANQSTNSELLNNSKANSHPLDESTDEDDELNDDEMDDSELRSSHSNSIDNHPTANLFNGFKENRTQTPTGENNNQMNNILGPALLSNNNKENDAAGGKEASGKEQLPFGQLGLSNLMNNDDLFRGLNRSNSSDLKNGGQTLVLSQNISSIGNSLSSNTDSLESLLRNIENLVSIAVQNARQQQQQLSLHKGKRLFLRKFLRKYNGKRFPRKRFPANTNRNENEDSSICGSYVDLMWILCRISLRNNELKRSSSNIKTVHRSV